MVIAHLLSLPAVLSVLGTAVLAHVGWTYVRLARGLGSPPPPRAPLARYPSITIIRPVRGCDAGAADNFRAALEMDYPGETETFFLFDDERDPGYAVARRAVLAHRASGRPGRAEVRVVGAPPPGCTGKLHAMMVGSALARGELIAFGDSDTRPDRDVLRVTVETLLGTPGAGSAFAPVVVNQPKRAAGDVLYALMLNVMYGAWAVLAAGPRRELPFIMGQLMVFRREALAAVGGVACARGQIVDDMYIGQRVHAAGYRNVMGAHPLYVFTSGMTLRQYLPIYRRWITFRSGLPFSFTRRQWVFGGEYFFGLLGAAVALAAGHPLAALAPASVAVAVSLSLGALDRRAGGAPIPLRLAWAQFVLLLLAPGILLWNFVLGSVDWRGRCYALVRGARLAAAGTGRESPRRLLGRRRRRARRTRGLRPALDRLGRGRVHPEGTERFGEW